MPEGVPEPKLEPHRQGQALQLPLTSHQLFPIHQCSILTAICTSVASTLEDSMRCPSQGEKVHEKGQPLSHLLG